MKNKILYGILALIISGATLLSACGSGDEKTSDGTSSGDMSITAEDVSTGAESETTSADASADTSADTSADASTDTSADTSADAPAGAPEDTSADTSTDASTDASEDTSTDTSGEDVDYSEIISIPEGYKGHLTGDAFELIDMKKGFGLNFSASNQMFGSVAVSMYAKGKSVFADLDMMGIKQTFLVADGKAYVFDSQKKKYQSADGTAEVFIDGLDISDMLSLGDVQFVSTTEETIDGVTYVVESYKATEGGAETITKYYFNNGKLEMGISDGATTKMSITDQLPDGIFEIPEGYTELMPGDIITVPEEYKDLAIGKALSKFNGNDGFSITAETLGEEGTVVSSDAMFIKGKNVRVDDGYLSENGEFSTTSLYVDGKEYTIDHTEKTYTVGDGNFLSSAEGLLDVLKYKETTTEKIEGKTYTVDVFEYAIEGFFTPDEGEKIKLYTLDGEWKYAFADGELTKVTLTALEETADLFAVPEGYTLDEEEFDFDFEINLGEL